MTISAIICDAMRDLVPFIQLKKREKQQKSDTLPWMFFTFFKSYKW